MSSILFVEVTEKHEDTLTFVLVEILEGFAFVESPTLALQLLLESWLSMMQGRLVSALQAHSRGGFYRPFPAEEASARAARSPIREICPEPEDELEFVRENAGRYIRSTEVFEKRHFLGMRNARVPSRHYFGPHAECLFRVRVRDPRWFDHLEPGVCWDTTAYPHERS